MADHYPIDDELAVGPEALKAIAEPNRSTILALLNDRPASITQLADAMERPKGSVGHHVQVLEDAGLIRVVDTRKVRAMTEKFYGRTARWFMVSGYEAAGVQPDFAVQEAMSRRPRGDKGQSGFVTARYARIPEHRADEFGKELVDLIDRFLATDSDGDTVYAMVAGIFGTTLPTLGATDD